MNYYHKVITEGYEEKFRENGQFQIGRQLAPPTLNRKIFLGQKSPFQLVQPKNPSTNGISNTSPMLRNTSNSGLTTLPNKPPSPYGQRQSVQDQPIYQNHPTPQLQQQQSQQQQQQQPPVTVIYPNASGYKSQIENKVNLKLMNQTYMSNMHVRVPSQDSSIYSDSKTYIDVGQPVAIGTYL